MASDDFERVGRVSVPRTSHHEGRGDPGVRAALAEMKKGYFIPADEIEAWVESWDTPNELPMPTPRRR